MVARTAAGMRYSQRNLTSKDHLSGWSSGWLSPIEQAAAMVCMCSVMVEIDLVLHCGVLGRPTVGQGHIILKCDWKSFTMGERRLEAPTNCLFHYLHQRSTRLGTFKGLSMILGFSVMHRIKDRGAHNNYKKF